MVDASDDDIYSGVVSIESLRIGFLISQLNDLNICAGDISMLTFLQGPRKRFILLLERSLEKTWKEDFY